jgi:hypothetical protein
MRNRLVQTRDQDLRNQASGGRRATSDSDKIDALINIECNCLGMFLKYDRVSASELTMSQVPGIQACQALGLYHDSK